MAQRDKEYIIRQVDGSMSIEGMPLTEADKQRIRDYAFDATQVDPVVAELVEKHSDSDDLYYDEIDEQLDRELFEAIFGTSELPEGITHKQAIGHAMATALDEDMWKEVEDLIEVPSRETFDEWIRKGEERRQQRENNHGEKV